MNQNDFFISPIRTQKDWDDGMGFSAIDAFLPKVLFSIITTEVRLNFMLTLEVLPIADWVADLVE
jgi:hypothetical protein